MSSLVVFVVVFAALFALAFFTKRRFGILGLALTAGATLSSLWADPLAQSLEDVGVVTGSLPVVAVTSISLLLLPPILAVFSKPKYHDSILRIGGAVCFALLGLAFSVGPLGAAFELDDQLYSLLAENYSYLVTAGLVLAMIDLLMTRGGGQPALKH